MAMSAASAMSGAPTFDTAPQNKKKNPKNTPDLKHAQWAGRVMKENKRRTLPKIKFFP